MKFDRRPATSGAKLPVKFQSDWSIFSKLHTVVKLRKICRKFISRKTDHSRYKHGLPLHLWVAFCDRATVFEQQSIDCISLHDCWWPEDTRNQGPFSISDKTSCCKIPWSLEAVRFVSRIRENCNMAISDGQLKYHQIRYPRWKHFFITHRNQRKQAYLYLSYKHLFVYLFVGFNQGFVHIFTRLYCFFFFVFFFFFGGGGFCPHTHTRTPLAKSRLCAVSNAPRSWEKREGCDSVSRCIPQ